MTPIPPVLVLPVERSTEVNTSPADGVLEIRPGAIPAVAAALVLQLDTWASTGPQPKEPTP